MPSMIPRLAPLILPSPDTPEVLLPGCLDMNTLGEIFVQIAQSR
jgi:hypothetical protein